jgi:hypothetical protein
LAQALITQGSSVQLVEVPFARHAFDVIPDGWPSYLALEAIAAFLNAL